MSTPFDVKAWARQAGIQTTGGFAVVAECVTLDELQRFAEIAISQAAKHYAERDTAPQPQPKQEPAKLKRGITGRCTRKYCECEKEGLGLECIHLEPLIDGYPIWSGIPQPQREWVGLTDEERSELWWNTDMNGMPEHDYGKAIEAKLKELNA